MGLNEIIEQRKRKLNELKELGINPYPYSFDRTINSKDLKEKYKNIKEDEFSEKEESIAGRIMALRIMGKISFMTIRDGNGDAQIVLKRDETKNYNILKKFDIGDFIGAKGKVGKTKKGEISIFADEIVLLAKSLRPLPEKYHGLKDQELKYRKRYLDLITNLDSRRIFYERSMIIREIRQFFYEKGFIEVETPILDTVYGGANARPFITHHNALDQDMFLKISPELYLKRLQIGGFENVFEITKCFRNEGVDTTHNPEFTMIEWYTAYHDYFYSMDLVEELIQRLAKKIRGTLKIEYGGKTIDLSHFERLTMFDAIKKYANYDVEKMSEDELRKICESHNIELVGDITKGVLINAIFEEFVEEKLIQPTFIIDYPKEISPLTKKHRSKEGLVERFELFIDGHEMSNAYSELNDPIDQRERFEREELDRKKGNDEAPPTDKEFIEAMEYGMPPMTGVGIGIDRLVMLLTGAETIRDVILFPTLKKEDSEDNGESSKDSKESKK